MDRTLVKANYDYKEHWADLEDHGPAIDTEDWHHEYAAEILTYLKGHRVIADTGCGSGEVLERIHQHFEKIYALDFSPKMIEVAQATMERRGIQNVELFCGDMIELDQLIPEKVDAVYNSGAIQYLTYQQVSDFVANCKKVLKPGGEVIIMNVPDINCRELYLMEFYRQEQPISFLQIIKRYVKLRWQFLKEKLKNFSYRFDDGIGYWFARSEFQEISQKHGYKCQIYYTRIWPYGYRFHVKMTLPT